MSKYFITVGISGSGKSTWIKRFIEENPKLTVEVISPDEIRKELTGDVSDQSQNKRVWDEAYLRLVEYVFPVDVVIFDSTACNLSTIRNIDSLLKDKEVTWVVFDVDPSIAKQRVAKDVATGVDRSVVPPEVIDKQYSRKQGVVEWLKANDKHIMRVKS